jgi:hypothetical protein
MKKAIIINNAYSCLVASVLQKTLDRWDIVIEYSNNENLEELKESLKLFKLNNEKILTIKINSPYVKKIYAIIINSFRSITSKIILNKYKEIYAPKNSVLSAFVAEEKLNTFDHGATEEIVRKKRVKNKRRWLALIFPALYRGIKNEKKIYTLNQLCSSAGIEILNVEDSDIDANIKIKIKEKYKNIKAMLLVPDMIISSDENEVNKIEMEVLDEIINKYNLNDESVLLKFHPDRKINKIKKKYKSIISEGTESLMPAEIFVLCLNIKDLYGMNSNAMLTCSHICKVIAIPEDKKLKRNETFIEIQNFYKDYKY